MMNRRVGWQRIQEYGNSDGWHERRVNAYFLKYSELIRIQRRQTGFCAYKLKIQSTFKWKMFMLLKRDRVEKCKNFLVFTFINGFSATIGIESSSPLTAVSKTLKYNCSLTKCWQSIKLRRKSWFCKSPIHHITTSHHVKLEIII